MAPVKFASPIIASVVEVGTPAVQLVAVAQLVLVVPFQLVCATAANDASRQRMMPAGNFVIFIVLDYGYLFF